LKRSEHIYVRVLFLTVSLQICDSIEKFTSRYEVNVNLNF